MTSACIFNNFLSVQFCDNCRFDTSSAFFSFLFRCSKLQITLFVLSFFFTFSSLSAVTIADLTPGLLSFLFSFDVKSSKSHDSFFLSFLLILSFSLKIITKTSEISPSVLSFFLEYYVYRHTDVHTTLAYHIIKSLFVCNSSFHISAFIIFSH